jgi:hypothetical protein
MFPGNSVSIETRLGAGRMAEEGIFFSSPPRQNWLWGPPCLLHNGTGGPKMKWIVNVMLQPLYLRYLPPSADTDVAAKRRIPVLPGIEPHSSSTPPITLSTELS